MKTISASIVSFLLLLICSGAVSQEVPDNSIASPNGVISVSYTTELSYLTSEWVSVYQSLNPGISINVVAPENIISAGDHSAGLRFATNKQLTSIAGEIDWKIVVGRDVIVPVMNAGNPFLDKISMQGISREEFVEIFSNPVKQVWGTVTAEGGKVPLHLYVVNDESVKYSVAKFISSASIPVHNVIYGSSEDVIAAISNDPYAIGFCSAIKILRTENQQFVENVQLLPIDKNNNGTIDYMEDIYSDANAFFRGVWIGKYPRSLYTNIFAVSKVKPTDKAELAFLTWILADGQQYLNSNGFSELSTAERQSQIENINLAAANTNPPKEASSKAGWLLLALTLIVAAGILARAGMRRYRKQESVIPDFRTDPTGFDESSVLVPKGLYFDKTHTWAFMEKDGIVTIGMDDFLQHITGPITHAVLKSPGELLKKGELLFSFNQSGKQLRMYSPVSGTIKKKNDLLVADSMLLNSSPYSEGWVYQIEPTNWMKEIQLLDVAKQYRNWLNTEFSRVKDFLAAMLNPESIQYNHIVLQDGGLLKEGILADFGPEIWEEFQINFLDTYK